MAVAVFGDTIRGYRRKSAARVTAAAAFAWDFSLLKDVTLREGHRLQIRFEAFNFSNHPNWIDPFTDVTNPNIFGRVPVAKRMREIQFGLKYLF